MKILEFFGEPLSYGGQEAFIYNMYVHFQKNAEYTFLTPFFANNEELLNVISAKSDKIIACNHEFQSAFRKKYIIDSALEFINNEYDVIHIHSGSVFTLLIVASIAKKKGVHRVIVHSHATGHVDMKHKLIKWVSDNSLEKKADVFLACSIEAGVFKYSDDIIRSKKFKIVKNGIDIDKFEFNKEYREKIRKELKIDNEKIICNIGRYSREKNQAFILDIAEEYMKVNKNMKVVFVGGNGTEERKLKEIVKQKNMEQNVIMLKERKDINQILSAADVFVFPSLFEGLGISAIEAQAAGLQTICSENVPNEVIVSHYYHKCLLSDGPKKWANYIMNLPETNRNGCKAEIEAKGYSAALCAKELEDIYFHENERE